MLSVALKAAVAALQERPGSGSSTRSIAGAFCESRISSRSIWERCRSALWFWKQQSQRPGALQEHHTALITAIAARAFRDCSSGGGSEATSKARNGQKLEAMTEDPARAWNGRHRTLQEHPVVPATIEKSSRSVAGAFCGAGGRSCSVPERRSSILSASRSISAGGIPWAGVQIVSENARRTTTTRFLAHEFFEKN